MSFFDIIILDTILMIFPISSIMLYKAYNTNRGRVSKKFAIDIACFSSLFLLINFLDLNNSYSILLINMPFIISVVQNRKMSAVLITFVLVGINLMVGANLTLTILEYGFYIIVLVILIKKCRNYKTVLLTFICIKGFFLTMDQYYLIKEGNYIFIFQILICLIVFYLSLVLIIEIIKKIEETVNLNQTLKELEREKNLKNSLFKITHEVKNPIAVCKGYLSMIDYDNKEKASKYNKIILSEIDRTLDILNNFSEYNKINVLLDIMDLEYLIEETIEEFYELFKEKNIIVNYKEYGEVYISGDYKRLKQVLINCLKNSVEAIIKDGKIDIRLYKKGHNAYFEILDNGCGMNDEELSNIGQLFYTSKEKGCGIGVSLSKEIIKLHGGDIMYKSKKGDYTKVVIRLPLVDLQ